MSQPDITPSQLRKLRSKAAKEGALDKAVIDTIAELDEEHRLYVFRPETRCRVCNSEMNVTVNRMLSHAMTYKDILRALEPVNRVLPEGDRITYNSVWQHAKKHYPLEQTASAVYRRMVEKRADEFNIDFVKGVGGALTPLAFLDVVMQRGFETLVDETTTVEVSTGMRAAEKLHQLTREQESSGDMAELMLQLNKVVEAVKATVPENMWPAILARIEGTEVPDILEAEFEDEPETVGHDPGDPDFDDEPEVD